MSEYKLQCRVAKTLRALGWLAYHVPNGASLRDGGKGWSSLKAQGALEGVADIIIMEDWRGDLAGEFGHGIAIELKWGSGKVSGEQKAFLSAARDRGWLTATCWTIEEVMVVLRKVRPWGGVRCF